MAQLNGTEPANTNTVVPLKPGMAGPPAPGIDVPLTKGDTSTKDYKQPGNQGWAGADARVDTLKMEKFDQATGKTTTIEAPIYKANNYGLHGYYTADKDGNAVGISAISPAAATGSNARAAVDKLMAEGKIPQSAIKTEQTHMQVAGADGSPRWLPIGRETGPQGRDLYNALENAGLDSDPAKVLGPGDTQAFKDGFNGMRDANNIAKVMVVGQALLDVAGTVPVNGRAGMPLKTGQSEAYTPQTRPYGPGGHPTEAAFPKGITQPEIIYAPRAPGLNDPVQTRDVKGNPIAKVVTADGPVLDANLQQVYRANPNEGVVDIKATSATGQADTPPVTQNSRSNPLQQATAALQNTQRDLGAKVDQFKQQAVTTYNQAGDLIKREVDMQVQGAKVVGQQVLDFLSGNGGPPGSGGLATAGGPSIGGTDGRKNDPSPGWQPMKIEGTGENGAPTSATYVTPDGKTTLTVERDKPTSQIMREQVDAALQAEPGKVTVIVTSKSNERYLTTTDAQGNKQSIFSDLPPDQQPRIFYIAGSKPETVDQILSGQQPDRSMSAQDGPPLDPATVGQVILSGGGNPFDSGRGLTSKIAELNGSQNPSTEGRPILTAVPSMLSTTAPFTDFAVTIDGAGKKGVTIPGAPDRAFISLPDMMRVPGHSDKTRAGLQDYLASLSASGSARPIGSGMINGAEQERMVQSYSPGAMDALRFIENNDFSRGFTPELTEQVAQFQLRYASDNRIAGKQLGYVGPEHQFYDAVAAAHPELDRSIGHGDLVAVGTLVELRSAAEMTGDYTFYNRVRGAYEKIGLPMTQEAWAARGLTPEVMESVVRTVAEGTSPVYRQPGPPGTASATRMQYSLNGGDASVGTRVFPPQ